MERLQAERIAIKYYGDLIKQRGNTTLMFSPQIGKNEWTTIEFLNAIVNDEPLENHSMNPIDSVLKMEKRMKEKGEDYLALMKTKYPDYNLENPVYVVVQKMKDTGKLWFEGLFESFEEAAQTPEMKYNNVMIIEI